MSTEVVITGSGVPHPAPGRAGPGVLVRRGDVVLQVDAGRATTLRLADAGQRPESISAVLLTHHHSDHLVDLVDLAMVRWLVGGDRVGAGTPEPLVVVAPEGPAAAYARSMLDAWSADIEVRKRNTGRPDGPAVEVVAFPAGDEPREVWRSEDGEVVVESAAVHHEPVVPAVGYRIRTPDGTIVVSGDTRACPEVAKLAAGAEVLVHESTRAHVFAGHIEGTPLEHIFAYHADSIAVGAVAAQAGVNHLVLTHLIPSPATGEDSAAFAEDARRGGFTGGIVVASDLDRLVLDCGDVAVARGVLQP